MPWLLQCKRTDLMMRVEYAGENRQLNELETNCQESPPAIRLKISQVGLRTYDCLTFGQTSNHAFPRCLSQWLLENFKRVIQFQLPLRGQCWNRSAQWMSCRTNFPMSWVNPRTPEESILAANSLRSSNCSIHRVAYGIMRFFLTVFKLIQVVENATSARIQTS